MKYDIDETLPLEAYLSAYLIHSYIYYELGRSVITDQEYDLIVEILLNRYEEVQVSKHPHKHLISEDQLKSYTAFTLSGKYPSIVKYTAAQLLLISEV